MTWAEQRQVATIVAALSNEERAQKVWAEYTKVRAALDTEQAAEQWYHVSLVDLRFHNQHGYVLVAQNRVDGFKRYHVLFADGTATAAEGLGVC